MEVSSMTCDHEILQLISSYDDGEATPEEAAHAAEHLANCSGCRKMLEQWQGHRQLFTWAYTREIPDEDNAVETLLRRVKKEETMPEEPMLHKDAQARKRNAFLLRRWGWATALAALFVLIFVAYQLITPLYFLKVGREVATTTTSRKMRIAFNVDLTLGPHTKISRLHKHTIHVEQGWVAVEVRSGSITISTPRIMVTDQGTKFHIGTGAKADYVTVEEGQIEAIAVGSPRVMYARQALLVDNQGKVTAFTEAEMQPVEKETCPPLRDRRRDEFVPATVEQLDWDDGIQRLATRFPNICLSGMHNTRSNPDPYVGRVIGYENSSSYSFRQTMVTHLPQIAQILAGGLSEETWELPLGVVQLTGITDPPGLVDDVYYLRLVPKGNAFAWRFTGSRGNEVEIPVSFQSPGPRSMTEARGAIWSLPMQQYSSTGVNHLFTTPGFISWWPGAMKPVLALRVVNGPRELPIWRDKRAMFTRLVRSCAGVPGLTLTYSQSNQFYLDPQRKYRMMIAWNDDAGRQLLRLSRQTGGSVLLGAIATERPLAKPAAAAGAYLVRFVQPAGKPPHLELTTPGRKPVAAWGGASCILPDKPELRSMDESGYSLRIPSESDPMTLQYDFASASNGAFPVQFAVRHRYPYNKGSIGRSMPAMGDIKLAQGCIQVMKP